MKGKGLGRFFTVYLETEEWRWRREAHQKRVRRFTQPSRQRASQQEAHPIYDFFKRYYTFSFGRLEQWHPPLGVELQKGDRAFFEPRYYSYSPQGDCGLDPRLVGEKLLERLLFSRELLRKTQARIGQYACFGLHEWAMLYSGAEIRHRESAPLRLPQREIDAVVQSRPLRCTHFDAFRFFAPDAQPLNQASLSLSTREDWEQPGCIHAVMDLYKWAYKAAPWTGSDLLYDCFCLAIEAREIDMRASPYDLSAWNYAPIAVETKAGRKQYEQSQRTLAKKGESLRQRLIQSLEELCGMVEKKSPAR